MNNFLNYVPVYGIWRMYKNNFEHLPLMSSIHFNGTAFAHAMYIVLMFVLWGIHY